MEAPPGVTTRSVGVTAGPPGEVKRAATNRDPHTAPLDPAPTTPAATVAAATAAKPAPAAKPAVLPAQAPTPATMPALQTATAPPPGVFAPPVTQPGRFTRSMPGASDLHSPSLLSFAPSAARAAPAPLTAMPDAKPAGKLADVPLPRPRPKLATATAAAKRTAPAQ